MEEADFNCFWLGADGNVWKLATYCNEPTATWQRVDDPSIRRGGAVGSSLAREFRRLVPEEK